MGEGGGGKVKKCQQALECLCGPWETRWWGLVFSISEGCHSLETPMLKKLLSRSPQWPSRVCCQGSLFTYHIDHDQFPHRGTEMGTFMSVCTKVPSECSPWVWWNNHIKSLCTSQQVRVLSLVLGSSFRKDIEVLEEIQRRAMKPVKGQEPS